MRWSSVRKTIETDTGSMVGANSEWKWQMDEEYRSKNHIANIVNRIHKANATQIHKHNGKNTLTHTRIAIKLHLHDSFKSISLCVLIRPPC